MEITQGVPFDSFGLSEATMRAIRNKGYTVSTPVQAGGAEPRPYAWYRARCKNGGGVRARPTA